MTKPTSSSSQAPQLFTSNQAGIEMHNSSGLTVSNLSKASVVQMISLKLLLQYKNSNTHVKLIKVLNSTIVILEFP